MTSASTGVWCGELELSGPRPGVLDVPGEQVFQAARILLRVHGDPVGYVRAPVQQGVVDVAAALTGVDAPTAARIDEHLRTEGLPPAQVRTAPAVPLPDATPQCTLHVDPVPFVSVVVCTRDRPELLRSCLRDLGRLTYPNLEVVVVDNAPRDDRTRTVVSEAAAQDPRVRYVTEPAPGLSRARNRGFAEAKGDLVAYTDDDVTVDPRWIEGVVRGFSRSDDVGCVTGLVCSASLTGPAEAYFDARVTWSVTCTPRLFRLDDDPLRNPLHPYSPGVFGTGANVTFSRRAVEALGGFDEALGAGTLTAGGEDLDAFVRVLFAGYALAYEPAALVWHHHRVDLDELRRQMHAYGTGLTAFLLKHLLDPRTRRSLLRRAPYGLVRMVGIPSGTRQALDDRVELPKGLLSTEFAGMLRGPLLYLRARRQAAAPR